MNKIIQIVALFGKSGSGKDYLCNQIVGMTPGYTQKVISYTTRPKRDYEMDGVDYHFITDEQFNLLKKENLFVESTHFLSYQYGTAVTSLANDRINVGVFNIKGIELLLKNDNISVFPILIAAPDKTRLIRLINRENSADCKEICRRFLADEEDFSIIPFEYKTHISGETFIFNKDDFN